MGQPEITDMETNFSSFLVKSSIKIRQIYLVCNNKRIDFRVLLILLLRLLIILSSCAAVVVAAAATAVAAALFSILSM
jgi:hypothetical protein